MLVWVSNELGKKIRFIFNDVIVKENEVLTEKEQIEFEKLREAIRTAPQKRFEM